MEAERKAFLRRRTGISHGNPTKQRLLELFAEFFCLTTNDAAGLLRDRVSTGSDARSVRRTLAILRRDGFVHRLDIVRGRGGATEVHGLAAKGTAFACRQGFSTPATKTFDEHSLRTLDHELEITAFHIALRRLCRERGLPYAYRQTDLKHNVHPDPLFYVADPASPGKAYCHFLEIERSKLRNYQNGEPQILRKLRAHYR